MDGREGMGVPRPAAFFMHRGMGSSFPGSQPGIHVPSLSSPTFPNFSPNFAAGSSAIGNDLGGGGSIGSAFHEASPPSVSPDGVNVGGGGEVGHGEQAKRKRGRPRKYGPDGTVSLGLSPMASTPSASGTIAAGPSGSAAAMQSLKRGRGRPPGSGRKQQLASLGEWVAGSAGIGFTPHIVTIEAGEDIASKIMSFSQQGPRAVCILSANGAVSTVSLHQPTTMGSTVTYEGQFEILNLSGSYFSTSEDGSRNQSGSLSVVLSNPEGRVIGGSVAGLLLAASSVQVILGSFIHTESKPKKKKNEKKRLMEEESAESEEGVVVGDEQSTSPNSSTLPGLGPTPSPMMGGWPGAGHNPFRNAHHGDIDLMRG
ncbi:Putative DNA-binding protein ESCAROLA [Apostasia shenzhenica]|uniref:AT-hook motif nuclear-localized protein n=1 Tax=Apostasia shenzhenica TaxID=1088818 RepID=A0A2H9ZXR0_9ASPA|nr:Putative DNA-binding protein ESCAROLA [Apostasia shenzhenica]